MQLNGKIAAWFKLKSNWSCLQWVVILNSKGVRKLVLGWLKLYHTKIVKKSDHPSVSSQKKRLRCIPFVVAVGKY